MLRNTDHSYGCISKLFHWTTALLIIFMLILGFLMGEIQNEQLQDQAYGLHKQIGLIIFGLTVLRCLWTLCNTKPILPIDMRWYEKFAAKSVHLLLYLILLVMPLTGLILSSYAGYPAHLFGMSIILPVTQSKPLSHLWGEIHEAIAWVIIVIVALHALAAIFHHVVRKDDVLKRMLSCSNCHSK